jgi:hypothetical protein
MHTFAAKLMLWGERPTLMLHWVSHDDGDDLLLRLRRSRVRRRTMMS